MLVWVVIISTKLARLERELAELTELAARKRGAGVEEEREVARVG